MNNKAVFINQFLVFGLVFFIVSNVSTLILLVFRTHSFFLSLFNVICALCFILLGTFIIFLFLINAFVFLLFNIVLSSWFSSSTYLIEEITFIQEWAGQSRFIRVMPNTPSAVGEAASGITFSLIYFFNI